MTFSDGGQFEGGRVRTGGGRRGVAVGGGVGGLVVVALIILLQGGTGQDVLDAITGGGAATSGTVGACTAEQANTDRTCRLSATVQALDAYWEPTLTAASTPFTRPEVVSFDGSTDTACGAATSSTGPFYCPPDRTIYLDTGFYDLLASQYGDTAGPLAQEYVTAHEYGHHIQQLLGTMDRVDHTGTGPASDSVRLELQADCYAGMWVGHAASTVDPDTGVTFLQPITAAQLADAFAAAKAVGDDHIQAAAGGGVDPDTWTHGSSAQRQKWFTTGYRQGTLAACDTFAVTTP